MQYFLEEFLNKIKTAVGISERTVKAMVERTPGILQRRTLNGNSGRIPGRNPN